MLNKKKPGKIDIEITPVGFGVLTIGKAQLNHPIKVGAELLEYALKKGINLIDTAQYYETYPYIKEALRSATRAPVIISKCLSPGYEEMKYAVEEARLETDRDFIDIFLLHEVRSDFDLSCRRGAWEYLLEAKAKGLVKAVGLSTHHVDVAESCACMPDIDVVFPLINFKSLGIRNGSGPGTKEDMAAAIKRNSEAGKAVFAMKVFGGGNLTGEYMTALDYVTGLPGVDSVVIGFGSKDEIDRIIEYTQGTIDREYVPDLRSKKIRIDAGDCEGCGLCIERCPARAISKNIHDKCEVDHSICLTCGYCSPVCPVRAIIMF